MLPSRMLQGQLLVLRSARLVVRAIPKSSSTLLKRLGVWIDGRTPPVELALGETRPALAVHQPKLHGLPSMADCSIEETEAILTGDQWLRLSVIRHPGERLLSFWHDKLHLGDPQYLGLNNLVNRSIGNDADLPCRFKDFVGYLDTHWDQLKSDGHIAPQVELLEPDAINYTVLIQRDKLTRGIEEHILPRLSGDISSIIEAELSDYSKYYSQKLGKKWQGCYNKGSLAILAKRYEGDFERLGFQPEEGRAYFVKSVKNCEQELLVDPAQQIRDRNSQIAALERQLLALRHQLADGLDEKLPPLDGSKDTECAAWPPHNSPEAELQSLYQGIEDKQHAMVIAELSTRKSSELRGEELYLLGIAEDLSGLHDQAMKHLSLALERGFKTPYVYFNIGNTKRACGSTSEGIEFYHKALAYFPKFPECRHNLALGYAELGEPKNAELVLRRLINDTPEFNQASFSLGNILRDQKRHAEAVEAYKLCLRHAPEYPDAWNNLGLAHGSLGDSDKAIDCYLKALTISHSFKPARQNLAQAYICQKKYPEALEEFDQFLRLNLNPTEHVAGVQGKVGALLELGRHAEAQSLAIEASDRRVSLLSSLHALPVIYENEEEVTLIREQVRDNLQQLYALLEGLTIDDPSYELLYCHAWSLTNFYLAYQMGDDRPLQELYAGILDRILRPRLGSYMQPLPKRAARERIRIGVISPHLKNHNGSIWCLGWLEGIRNNAAYEIFSYNIGEEEDSGSARFASLGNYRHLPLYPNNASSVLETIRNDDLDLMIFTDIGMHPSSKIISVMHLAAVQAQGWGHPITSGSQTMNYFLSGEGMEGPEAENHYSEILFKLPHSGLNYEVPTAPSLEQDLYSKFLLPEDRPLLLSLQSTFKYVPQNDSVFADIAEQNPEALILLVGHMGYQGVADRLLARMSRAFEKRKLKIDEHIRVLPRLDYPDYMGLFAIAHHTLDTIDWNGGNSSFQSFSLDCPVVTLPTDFMRGRHTVAMLEQMKIPELVANSRENYVEISSRLLKQPAFYNEMKERISHQKTQLFGQLDVAKAFKTFVDATTLSPKVVQSPSLPSASVIDLAA